MTTEHDLDTRLLAARGVDDADLPALPEAFLDHLHASDAGRTDIARTLSVVPARRRRPRRRTVLRMGAAVVAAAAACTIAVLVTGNDTTGHHAVPPPPEHAKQVDGVRLVHFDTPAYPLTLPTPPPGTSGPVFGGAGVDAAMTYTNTKDSSAFVIINVGSEAPPSGGSVGFPGSRPENVTVNGTPAVIVVPTTADESRTATLDWQRAPGQWVTIFAQGRYAQRDLLLTLAGSLVDRPQAMPVQLHVAPDGYRLDFFKENGRVVRLADEADVDRGLTVRLPFPGETDPVVQLPDVAAGTAGPVEQVTVHGQPAQLVRSDFGGGGKQGWFLQARFPDGTTFVVEAPGSLAESQVVQIADQVTYTR